MSEFNTYKLYRYNCGHIVEEPCNKKNAECDWCREWKYGKSPVEQADEKLLKIIRYIDDEDSEDISRIFEELKQQYRENNRFLQQENTQLKSDIQALRELLKEIEVQNQFCTICGTWEWHKEGCVLKAELDKIEAVE